MKFPKGRKHLNKRDIAQGTYRGPNNQIREVVRIQNGMVKYCMLNTGSKTGRTTLPLGKTRWISVDEFAVWAEMQIIS